MDKNILNKIISGSDFYIWATIKGVQLQFEDVSLYEIYGDVNLIENTITITATVQINRMYHKVFEGITSVEEIVTNPYEFFDMLEQARCAAMDVVAAESLSDIISDLNAPNPRTYIADLIEENITVMEPAKKQERKDTISYTKETTVVMQEQENAQKRFNEIFRFILERAEMFIISRKLFVCTIDYKATLSVDEKQQITGKTMIDTTVAFGGILLCGALSYFGEDHKLLNNNEPPCMIYLPSDYKDDLIGIVQTDFYNMIRLISKVTSNPIIVNVEIKEKEEEEWKCLKS